MSSGCAVRAVPAAFTDRPGLVCTRTRAPAPAGPAARAVLPARHSLPEATDIARTTRGRLP